MKLKYLSLFSGIGGFEHGIEEAYKNIGKQEPFRKGAIRSDIQRQGGISKLNSYRKEPQSEQGCGVCKWICGCVGFSEIDKYATAVYKYHFPTHRELGDITKINWEEVEDFDMLCGGFPCQAFSVAGKRLGFADKRGTLFFEIERCLIAKRPKYVFLENVKGLLSHDKGNTFKVIILSLAELGYDVEWFVLNSKYHGVPQNRERIFIIGHLGGMRGQEVFPFGDFNEEVGDQSDEQGDGKAFVSNASPREFGWKSQSPAVCARDYKEPKIVAQKGVSVQGFGGKRVLKGVDTAGTIKTNANNLDSAGNTGVVVGTYRTHNKEGFRECKGGVAPTIMARAREDGSSQEVIAVPKTTMIHQGVLRKGEYGDGTKEDCAFTLDGTCGRDLLVPAKIEELSPYQGDKVHQKDGTMSCLSSQGGNKWKGIGLQDGIQIRRLTPTECERLQSFPDYWTKIGVFDGIEKEISDSQRYKMLGNAVTTNVIRDIVTQMFFVEKVEPPKPKNNFW